MPFSLLGRVDPLLRLDSIKKAGLTRVRFISGGATHAGRGRRNLTYVMEDRALKIQSRQIPACEIGPPRSIECL